MNEINLGNVCWIKIANKSRSILGKYSELLWGTILRALLKMKKNGNILDLGCGNGSFLKTAENHYVSFGLDVDTLSMKESKTKCKKTFLTLSSATNLPVKNVYFDVVTAFEVLEHIINPFEVMSQIYHVLKDDGVFIMSTPNLSSFGRKIKGDKWYGFSDPTHISLLSPEIWIEMISRCGFEVIDSYSSGLWDTPYIRGMPLLLQHLFIRGSSILFFSLGFKLPKFGEHLFIISKKIHMSKVVAIE